MKSKITIKNTSFLGKVLAFVKKLVLFVVDLIKGFFRELKYFGQFLKRIPLIKRFVPSQRTALVLLAVLMFFATVIDVINIAPVERVYAIDEETEELIGPSIDKFEQVLEYSRESDAFEYNENFTPSHNVGGTSQRPQFVANLSNDIEEKGIEVFDPVNGVSVKLISKDDSDLPGKNGSRIVYPLKDMDALRIFSLNAASIKEDLILNSYIADELSFDYELELSPGLEARAESDGSIGVYGVAAELLGNVQTGSEEDKQLLDQARENSTKNRLLFKIPAPFIVESNRQTSEADTWYTLNGNTLTLHANNLGVATYPLSIDPSIYVQTAARLMRGNNETNTDFDVDNELIQKSQTTGARIDAWQSNLDMNSGIWGHASATAGGYVYRSGGRTGKTIPQIVDQEESVQGSTSTSFVMNMPATRPAGDLYVAMMCHDGTGSVTPPSGGGWTEYSDDDEHAAYYKIGTDEGGGNEAASYTWTGSNEQWMGTIVRVTGFDSGDVVSGTAGTTNSSGTPTFPATTPDEDATLVLRSVGVDNDAPSDTGWVPSGHTKIASGTSSGTTGDCGYAIASMDVPPAASVSTGTASLGEMNDTYGGASIAINPVSVTEATQDTVEWAQFNSSTLQIESPNPGTGACTNWCNESVYDLPAARRDHKMIAYNGYLYAMGGLDSSGNRVSTVYIAKLGANGEPQLWHPTDPDKSNWDYWYTDTGLSSGTAKTGFSVVVSNNRMYVLGGSTNASTNGITTVEKADILPNGRLGTWTTTGMQVLPSGAGTHMGAAQVYNDVIYTMGGFEGAATSSANLRSSVYYSKLNADGSMNDWQSTDSFTTARAAVGGGEISYIFGAYIYLGGGCEAVNGSGYCSTISSDMQLASINADGSLDRWTDLGSLDNTRLGYTLMGWQGGLYRIGGCANQDTTGGECISTVADVDYGTINPAGEVSTVEITETSGSGDCTGGSPFNCDLPPVGDDAGEGGQMLSMSVVLNGYLYVIGGCVEYQCDGADEGSGDDDDSSGNISYVSVGPNGDLEAPSTCSGTSYGAWCTDASNRVNGTDGVSAAGVTVFNGRIYVVGGFEDNAGGNGDFSTNIYYNSTNTDGSLAGAWSSNDLTSIGASDVAYTYTFARANPASAGTVPGNLYILGGCDALGTPPSCSDYHTGVYKCDIGTSGAVSNCTTSGQLQIDSTPGSGGSDGLGIHSGTVYANYIYLIGGYSNAEADKDDVLYAQIDDNNDIVAVSGSDWVESPNKLAVGRRRGFAFGYNGHIYSVGGYDADTSQTIPFIEWAKIDVSDGSIDPFTTSSVQINQRWGLSMTVSNSYAYVIGGCDVGSSPSGCTSFEPSVQIFQLFNNDSGSVDDFTAQTDQTFSANTDRWGASAAVLDGYLYVAGGCTSATDCTTVTDDVQYASISADDGSIGTWASLETLPAGRAWGYLGVAGGDLYYVGGEDGSGDEKSDVYYITPNPSGSGLGQLEHYSARRELQETKSSDGWSAVSGSADTGTTASTNGFVDSTNLTAGQDYLVMVWASHNDSNGSTQSGVRVTHGGTPFTESQAIEDVDRTNAAYKTPYFWFDVWTAVANEDLEVEYYRNGSGTARVEDVTMLVMNAEDLVSDGDLQYDIDTGGGSLTDTFTANSSITWTPDNNNDSWWIMGYVQGDTGASVGDQLEYQFNIDSGTIRSTASIEGEVSTDTPLYGIGWVEPLSDSSHTVDLEIRESIDNDHFEWDASGIMALNLDRFEDFAEYSVAGDGTNITTVNTWVEQGNIDPTVSTQGDFIIAAGGISDDDNRRMQHRIQLGGTNITDVVGGWQQSSADKVPYTLADMQIDLTTGSKDIDYDSQYTSGSSTVNVEDRWVVALSMEQGGTNSWATASNDLPGDRSRFGAAVWNNRIYVVGGLDDSASETNTVYHSPQLNSGGDITSAWTTTTAFDTARQGGAVTAYANNLYLFGGYDGSNYLSDTQFTQINTDGTVDAWTFSEQMQNPIRDAVAVSANGYIYLIGGRTAASTCNPKVQVVPISANTTIASGNNPTGVGSWFETNVRYTGDRYGAAVAYEDGKIYTMGGGCSSPLSSNRHYESTLNSQPQVAQYSRLIDTDTDVFPNSWLVNGLDNSIGARWEVRYRSMHDLDNEVNPNEDCGSSETMPQMTTFGQETDYGEVTLGDVAGYTALNDSGEDINCARYFYFFIEIDASRTFGYPEDVNRGPTIDDLSLFFTSDPSKRLRHGKTWTGGEQQPLDTPCGQSVDADCPNP